LPQARRGFSEATAHQLQSGFCLRLRRVCGNTQGPGEREMKFRDLSFIAMVAIVVIGSQALSIVNKAPTMPKDIHHATACHYARLQCLGCHQAQTL
jgi:hypothetical protein